MKDRGKLFKNILEEEWYELAYGKKRNIMKYRMELPISEMKFPIKYLFFAEVSYTIFPEHAKEFASMKFDPKFIVPLKEDDYTPNHFETEIELPFG